MRLFLLLPLPLGFSVPVIAHNEANGGCGMPCEQGLFRD